MATSSLKMSLAQALADYLAAAVPGLDCQAGSADPEQAMKGPSLQVLPHKVRFFPFISQDVAGGDDTVGVVTAGVATDLVLDLGEFSGPIELRLAARSQAERERYQAAVLSALSADEDRPGTTALQMPPAQFETASGSVLTNFAPIGAVHLDGDDWQEEMAWAKRRFAWLEVEAQYPMLVLRRAVPNAEELVLELTEDTTTSDVDAIPADKVEEVQVLQDGSVAQP